MGNIIAISSAAVFHFPAGEREKPDGEI
jgi:hypothetical protein